MTLREIGWVFTGHAKARQSSIDLAYYTAWHAGLFSQPFKPGKFPSYEKHMPGKKRREKARPMTPEQLKAQLLAFTAAMGGTIRKRGQ